WSPRSPARHRASASTRSTSSATSTGWMGRSSRGSAPRASSRERGQGRPRTPYLTVAFALPWPVVVTVHVSLNRATSANLFRRVTVSFRTSSDAPTGTIASPPGARNSRTRTHVSSGPQLGHWAFEQSESCSHGRTTFSEQCDEARQISPATHVGQAPGEQSRFVLHATSVETEQCFRSKVVVWDIFVPPTSRSSVHESTLPPFRRKVHGGRPPFGLLSFRSTSRRFTALPPAAPGS